MNTRLFHLSRERTLPDRGFDSCRFMAELHPEFVSSWVRFANRSQPPLEHGSLGQNADFLPRRVCASRRLWVWRRPAAGPPRP